MDGKWKIFATRKIPEEGLKALEPFCEIDFWEEEIPIPREELKKRVRGIDGLICLLSDKIDREIIKLPPKLKVIATYAVGFDNIDTLYAKEKGIHVGNTPDVLTETTADLAFSLLTSCARRIPEGIDYVKEGKWITWGPKLLPGNDVFGSTLGIIGFGRIGQAVAKRAQGFSMKTLYFSSNRKPELEKSLNCEYSQFEEILKEADFISLHTPLVPKTKGLFNDKAFSMMKKNAILINTARGGIVETPALVKALKEGIIAGAGLDVTDPEPLPANHELLKLKNCIVIPHIGSASKKTREKMSFMVSENILAGLKGEKLPYEVV